MNGYLYIFISIKQDRITVNWYRVVVILKLCFVYIY